ncbi:hypothetical protein I8752_27325 [Nostocaceae cyanobacterium CENA369]|uniref:Uncharacterized protein n=1 Tax=Dendronalium phyllosphericum CENA369 TaxID=1725256 RepID=A0A8J7LIB0_9NOST|nr:hypothetical protein [Dendronalium phyllosphericum]MBH8576634.1 hypothetical protein [Dendronalium phyllosphericum CENA369]
MAIAKYDNIVCFQDGYDRTIDDNQESEAVAFCAHATNESISVKTGNGYNFHFWPPGRASINPIDVMGMFTTVQARLVVDDFNKPDDRSKARYILSMGGDYWFNLTAQWNNWTTK